jgi:hypothetical protein
MNINLTYISDNGTSFPLVATSMYIKTGSFHEYSWNPEAVSYKYGDLLKIFTKEAQQYNCTLAFSGAQADIERNIETIHDAWEHDIMLQRPGKLVWNDYSIECYFIQSKTYPNNSNTRTLNDCTIYCPYPFWTKETKYEIQATGADEIIDGLDFPFDLPCDLGVAGYRRVINFDTSIPLDFRMVIYGVITNPCIYINGHLYEVDITVPANSHLTISSIEKNDREKAVTLTYPSGRTSSVLYARNRESYIFEPIVGNGQIIVSTPQTMRFDLYLIEKRSEPKWT